VAHRSLLNLRRRLFTILSAISLLLCVAAAWLWQRSYNVADAWTIPDLSRHPDRTRSEELRSETGLVSIETWHGIFGTTFDHWAYDNSAPGAFSQPAGVIRFRYDHTSEGMSIYFPHWFVFAVLAILPTIWFIQFRRRRRLKPGHCPHCNYDLRATPDRCPECGHVASSN
jgi:hypothetical protein